MIHGVINIYKEKGYTSHDVVAKMRGILRQRKIGHTGTLDPDAEGVLPVCLGAGTKLCDMLTEHDKTYRAVMLLGKVTDTQDVSGMVLRETTPDVTEEEVRETIAGFVGDYDQIPPMYSAIKVNGKKLYELAREGKTIERKARHVVIHGIEIEEVNLLRVTMTVNCSSGTYIRTLCHDIGEKLGCGACMEELTRTRVGQFRIEDSIRLAELEEKVQSHRLQENIISIEEMFSDLPVVKTKPECDRLLYNGNPLYISQVVEVDKTENGKWVRMKDSKGSFYGIYEKKKQYGKFHPVKMFFME